MSKKKKMKKLFSTYVDGEVLRELETGVATGTLVGETFLRVSEGLTFLGTFVVGVNDVGTVFTAGRGLGGVTLGGTLPTNFFGGRSRVGMTTGFSSGDSRFLLVTMRVSAVYESLVLLVALVGSLAFGGGVAFTTWCLTVFGVVVPVGRGV